MYILTHIDMHSNVYRDLGKGYDNCTNFLVFFKFLHYLSLSLFPLFPQIGSIEPKPRRDILMTDFGVVETAEFPA